jgi:hypothetical protein
MYNLILETFLTFKYYISFLQKKMKIILALTLVAILGLGALVPGITSAPKLAFADDKGDNDSDGGSSAAGNAAAAAAAAGNN